VAPQPIRAIIFDCDGTLVDSEPFHYEAWRLALLKHDYELSLEEYLSHVGKSTQKIADDFALILGCECSNLIHDNKKSYFEEIQQEGIPAIQGTVDFVRRLAQEKDKRGLKVGLASALYKNVLIEMVRYLEIEDCFDLIISGQDDLNEYSDPEGVNKPKPYIYLHTAKLLNVSPSQCVVIEDSFSGVTASATAGCITVAVPSKYTADHDFSRADFIVSSLADLSIDQFLEKIKK
jgi:HAD superfamily hydrolase (TIGR01509 family)